MAERIGRGATSACGVQASRWLENHRAWVLGQASKVGVEIAWMFI